MSKGLTDEQVRAEIKLLSECPEVKLARAELRQRYRERQRLYTLRNLAKRGAELRAQGKNIEDFRAKDPEDEDELLIAATEGAVPRSSVSGEMRDSDISFGTKGDSAGFNARYCGTSFDNPLK